MIKHFLASTDDNDNIGVLALDIDTDKMHDLRSAISHSEGLKKMLNEEFGTDDVTIAESDVKLESIDESFPAKIVVEITYDDGESANDITLCETWLY